MTMSGTVRGFRPLFVASVKMFYRSVDTVLFWVVSPVMLVGILALVRELDFGFGDRGATIDFFTFSAIGYAAFIGAHFAQDGMVGAAAGYRAQGVLKRIAATPISPAAFIAAQVLARLVAGLLATLALLALAVALGVSVDYTANLAWVAPLGVIAVLTAVGFAFAIAGWMPTPDAANQLNIALFTPVFLLNGVQYPLEAMPEVARDVGEYVVPFTALVEMFRGVLDGAAITGFARQIAIALGWLALAFALAVRAYRFTDR
jgi:ABC-2 type transport system permease protein